MWLLLFALACGSSVPSYEGQVQVVGLVKGWDGTGDVAVEACGAGTLVEPDGSFVAEMHGSCALRLVWERDLARAVGPWVQLRPAAARIGLTLQLPDAADLKPLSAS